MRIPGDIDRSAHDVKIEPALDPTDIDTCGGGFHPQPNSRRYPDLESRWLGIPIVHRFHEHLGAGIAAAHVEIIAGAECASHHDGVLAPPVHDDATDHVDDAERAFHPEWNLALDLFLGDDRRRGKRNRGCTYDAGAAQCGPPSGTIAYGPRVSFHASSPPSA